MDFIKNIQLKKNLLTKNELKACEAILDDLLLVQELSFTDLSERLGSTKASILRFCKKVGYSGYNEFKFECIRYVNSLNNISEEKASGDLTDIRKVSNIYSSVMELMEKVIDEKELIKLINNIKKARRIRLVGMLNSSIPCVQMRYAFLMFGIEMSIVSSTEELKAIDLSVNKDDLTIIFSVSAKSDSVQKAFEITKNSGANISLITMNSNSKYRDVMDSFIVLPSVSNLKNQSLLNSVPIFSVFVQVLIFYYSK